MLKWTFGNISLNVMALGVTPMYTACKQRDKTRTHAL